MSADHTENRDMNRHHVIRGHMVSRGHMTNSGDHMTNSGDHMISSTAHHIESAAGVRGQVRRANSNAMYIQSVNRRGRGQGTSAHAAPHRHTKTSQTGDRRVAGSHTVNRLNELANIFCNFLCRSIIYCTYQSPFQIQLLAVTLAIKHILVIKINVIKNL